MPNAQPLVLAAMLANVKLMQEQQLKVTQKANAKPPGGGDLPCLDLIEQAKKVLRKQPIPPMTTSLIPISF